MDNLLQMNKFEIVDMPGMNTLAYLVERDFEAYQKGYALLSLEKIRSSEYEESGKMHKVFNVLVNNPKDEDDIILLTLTDKDAFLSTGILDNNGFRTVATDVPLNYGSIFNTEGVEYKEVNYTPDLRRNFTIVDTQTGEEVKPTLYKDNETGEIKGRCKLMPNRAYIVLEVTIEDADVMKYLEKMDENKASNNVEEEFSTKSDSILNEEDEMI